MMHTKKVLLIDDKKSHQKGCGTVFLRGLKNDLRQFVDFRDSLDSVANFREDTLELVIKPEDYCCILIHASYDSPLLDESDLSELFSMLNNDQLVLFSGNSVIENRPNNIKRTSRERLFAELTKALVAYSKTGFFHTPYLYDSKTKLQVPLIHRLMDILESSKEEFLHSQDLKNWLDILGYSDSYEKVIDRYSKLSVFDLNEKLGDWLIKDIIW